MACVAVAPSPSLQDEDQAFWALLLPESEMRAVERTLAGMLLGIKDLGCYPRAE